MKKDKHVVVTRLRKLESRLARIKGLLDRYHFSISGCPDDNHAEIVVQHFQKD